MPEKLRIVDGILYRGDGKPVSVADEDEHRRTAYRQAQQRYHAEGNAGWLPDGEYVLTDGRMEAANA